MRAVRFDRYGGIDQLYVTDVPDPEAAPGRVVVRVRSTSINPGALAALSGAFVPIRDLAGVLDIPIASVYPLDRVREAYRRLAERHTRGKIVLHPQE